MPQNSCGCLKIAAELGFLRQSHYQVLITTAGLPVEMIRKYDNVFVEELADGDSLMSVSDVTITHGGNGTVYQALSQGVPVLGIPTFFDQEVNLQRVEALGAGLRMERRHYKAERLRSDIEKILGTPSFAQSAAVLRDSILSYDAPRTAAHHIAHFVETRDPLSLPPQDPKVPEPKPLAAPALQGQVGASAPAPEVLPRRQTGVR